MMRGGICLGMLDGLLSLKPWSYHSGMLSTHSNSFSHCSIYLCSHSCQRRCLLLRCSCSVSCHNICGSGCIADIAMDCTRGTDSHSIYNWAENMRYWSTDFDVPFPGSEGAKVHTGLVRLPPASKGQLVCRQSAVMLTFVRNHHPCKRVHVRLCQTRGLVYPKC